MTEREKKLLVFLGWAFFLSVCSVLAAIGMDRLRETTSSLEHYRSQLARIESRASEDQGLLKIRISSLKETVARVEEHAGDAGKEKDLADFGAAVRRSLKSAGAEVLRYQPAPASASRSKDKVEPSSEAQKDSLFLEFTARGSSLALSYFLRAAMDSDWTVSFLSVRSESAASPVEFTLRISYGN